MNRLLPGGRKLTVSRTPDTCWGYRRSDSAAEDADDRYALYLPRNLSYCALCLEALRDHVTRKFRLLDRCLADLQLTPSTQDPDVSTSSAGDVEDRKRLVPGSRRPSSILQPTQRRTRSLPPRSRGRLQKRVRFADSHGLELETVRHTLFSDLPPKVPSSAFCDLRPESPPPLMQLRADFLDPWTQPDRDSRLQEQGVLLRSLEPDASALYGVLSVLNLTYRKKVSVRYTLDDWRTYEEVPATYLRPGPPTYGGQSTDHFRFTIFAGLWDFRGVAGDVRLTFALRYQTEDGREFWDNNRGRDYSLTGSSRQRLPYDLALGHSWLHFL